MFLCKVIICHLFVGRGLLQQLRLKLQNPNKLVYNIGYHFKDCWVADAYTSEMHVKLWSGTRKGSSSVGKDGAGRNILAGC